MSSKFLNFKFLFSVLAFFILGIYSYTNLLPYYFSPQWEPTESEVMKENHYDENDQVGYFLGKKVQSSKGEEVNVPRVDVLGESNQQKRIEVDLTNQKVYAFEGDTKVMEFVVSTGKWGRTPTGIFNIKYKNYVQKMEGGNKLLNTYYYLPNVHYVQFFGNDELSWAKGFSFHEAYWHNNFGSPMSHGCINMRKEDAKALYYWSSPEIGDKRWIKSDDANPGTMVVIYGKTPST